MLLEFTTLARKDDIFSAGTYNINSLSISGKPTSTWLPIVLELTMGRSRQRAPYYPGIDVDDLSSRVYRSEKILPSKTSVQPKEIIIFYDDTSNCFSPLMRYTLLSLSCVLAFIIRLFSVDSWESVCSFNVPLSHVHS